MLPNSNRIEIVGTVSEPREGRNNPMVISEQFASVNIAAGEPGRRAFVEVVASNGTSAKIAALKPGQTAGFVGRLDSKKGTDNRWRLRVWAEEVVPADTQQQLDTEGAAA